MADKEKLITGKETSSQASRSTSDKRKALDSDGSYSEEDSPIKRRRRTKGRCLFLSGDTGTVS